jgi:protein required for attachment to host cells
MWGVEWAFARSARWRSVMIIKHGTLVVVADAAGAVIFRNVGQQGAVKLEVCETHNAKNSSYSRGDGPDRPSRYAILESGKAAEAWHDNPDQGERRFAARLARHVDDLIAAPAHGKDRSGFVICSSARFLGMMRTEYSTRAKLALRAEICKNLREAHPKQMEQALAGLNYA